MKKVIDHSTKISTFDSIAMKKLYFILVVSLPALLISGCQKTELSDWAPSNDDAIELRSSEEEKVEDGVNPLDNPDDIVRWKPEILPPSAPGVVKEVSDGDDESDNDENN